MFENMYILFIVLAFMFLVAALIFNKREMLVARVAFIFISITLFGALAMASAQVEVVNCGYNNISKATIGGNTIYTPEQKCTTENYYYGENMYIFGFMALFGGVIALILMLKFTEMIR